MIQFLLHYLELLFPMVLTPEAEYFLNKYHEQHGSLNPSNLKPFIVDGKTYTWKVLR